MDKARELYNPHLGDLTEFINNNRGLVSDVAIRWAKKTKANLDMDDLMQEGTLGLIKAYSRYVPDKNAKFSTYAYFHIQKSIYVYVRDHTEAIKPTRWYYEIGGKIIKQNLLEESPEKISRILGCSVDAAKRALEYIERKNTFSLNSTITSAEDSETELIDLIQTYQDYSQIFVNDFMELLGETDSTIVKCLLYDMTQKEIGHVIGTSQMQVCRKLKMIRTHAKEYFGRGIA